MIWWHHILLCFFLSVNSLSHIHLFHRACLSSNGMDGGPGRQQIRYIRDVTLNGPFALHKPMDEFTCIQPSRWPVPASASSAQGRGVPLLLRHLAPFPIINNCPSKACAWLACAQVKHGQDYHLERFHSLLQLQYLLAPDRSSQIIVIKWLGKCVCVEVV